jgi:hypothetical protein
MMRHYTANVLILAGLVALAGCAGGGATIAAPAAPGLKVPAWARATPRGEQRATRLSLATPLAPRLKVPTWAKTAPPLTEQRAARLIRDYGVRRSGQMLMERDPSEVKLLFGSFTNPGAHEAVASVQTGLPGRHAWQAWLLEWRETGWLAVRPLASNCSGEAAQAKLDSAGPAILFLRDSCSRFGHEEGTVRLIALGPARDKVLFAARESGGEPAKGDVLSVRHTVWLTGFDANGEAEVVDLAFTQRRVPGQGSSRDGIISTVTTYRQGGQGLVAVGPSTETTPADRIAASTW